MWQKNGLKKTFSPLTHLKVFIEKTQFGNRLESVVLLPARDLLLLGYTGAVAENQILYPPVEEKKSYSSSDSVGQYRDGV